jgi:Cu/Ag efflux protein CusF
MKVISPRAVVSIAILLAGLCSATAASSAMQPGFFGDTVDEATATIPTEEPLAAGTVVAVDTVRGRITLDYRPVPRLFLEGGTRVFEVTDAKMLKGLSAGDRVRFDVERDGRRYRVTRLENSN